MMKGLIAILGLVVMAFASLAIITGTFFSFVGICGPAPDAWKVLVAGAIGFFLGLLLVAPWYTEDRARPRKEDVESRS